MDLSKIKDSAIINEAIKRLLKNAKAATGIHLAFGTLEIAIHDGKFRNINFLTKTRCFQKTEGGRNG